MVPASPDIPLDRDVAWGFASGQSFNKPLRRGFSECGAVVIDDALPTDFDS
jgi:hypothetical protein